MNYFNNVLSPDGYGNSKTWLQDMQDEGFDIVTSFYYLLDWIKNDAGASKDKTAWWYNCLPQMFMSIINGERDKSDINAKAKIQDFKEDLIDEVAEHRLIDEDDPNRVVYKLIRKVWYEHFPR